MLQQYGECHPPGDLPPPILIVTRCCPCRAGGDEEEEEDLSKNKIVQFCKSLMSFTDSYDGDKFFTMQVKRCHTNVGTLCGGCAAPTLPWQRPSALALPSVQNCRAEWAGLVWLSVCRTACAWRRRCCLCCWWWSCPMLCLL